MSIINYHVFSRNVSDLPEIKSFSWLKTKCLSRKKYPIFKMSQKWRIKLRDFILEKSPIVALHLLKKKSWKSVDNWIWDKNLKELYKKCYFNFPPGKFYSTLLELGTELYSCSSKLINKRTSSQLLSTFSTLPLILRYCSLRNYFYHEVVISKFPCWFRIKDFVQLQLRFFSQHVSFVI